jgi:hypothetical protein
MIAPGYIYSETALVLASYPGNSRNDFSSVILNGVKNPSRHRAEAQPKDFIKKL